MWLNNWLNIERDGRLVYWLKIIACWVVIFIIVGWLGSKSDSCTSYFSEYDYRCPQSN